MVEISYRLERRDVSAWYWRRWRQGHWVIHLVVVFGAVCSGIIAADDTPALEAGLVGFGIGVLVVAGLMLYPMVSFRPEQRTVRLSDAGMESIVGGVTTLRPWNEVAGIRDEDGTLVVNVSSGKGFVIPPGAFGTEGEKREFLRVAEREIEVNRRED